MSYCHLNKNDSFAGHGDLSLLSRPLGGRDMRITESSRLINTISELQVIPGWRVMHAVQNDKNILI